MSWHRPFLSTVYSGAHKTSTYGCGRTCAAAGCQTLLSRYNPCAYCSVHEHLARREPRSRPARKPQERICANPGCTVRFETRSPQRRYCSDRCRNAAFTVARGCKDRTTGNTQSERRQRAQGT